jgi:glutamyl-tRNA synthetase
MPAVRQKTRLAPSPTGALHIGNARTFLVTWLLARKNGWKIHLRIEDLDGPRVKFGADLALVLDLNFLDLDVDEGPVYQSMRGEVYREAIDHLLAQGLAYPCVCSRREVDLAASAPHAEDGSVIYPGTCRGKFKSIADARRKTGRRPAIRFAAPDRDVEFTDAFAGRQVLNVARRLGDFVIAKADGTAAYQLAVVVDDLDAKITQVIRGNDLLESTFRQILLYDALGAPDRLPNYVHLPLVVGTDGLRLAKRHGDTRVATYREAGVSTGKMLSFLARTCGLDRDVSKAADLIAAFDLRTIPQAPYVFTAQDDAWLRSGATDDPQE